MPKAKTVKSTPKKKTLTADEVNVLIDEALESFSDAMYEEFEEMQKTIDEIANDIGADSLGFISIDGLYRAMGETSRNNDIPQFCDACFTGDYPIKLASGLSSKRVSHGNSR